MEGQVSYHLECFEMDVDGTHLNIGVLQPGILHIMLVVNSGHEGVFTILGGGLKLVYFLLKSGGGEVCE